MRADIIARLRASMHAGLHSNLLAVIKEHLRASMPTLLRADLLAFLLAFLHACVCSCMREIKVAELLAPPRWKSDATTRDGKCLSTSNYCASPMRNRWEFRARKTSTQNRDHPPQQLDSLTI